MIERAALAQISMLECWKLDGLLRVKFGRKGLYMKIFWALLGVKVNLQKTPTCIV